MRNRKRYDIRFVSTCCGHPTYLDDQGRHVCCRCGEQTVMRFKTLLYAIKRKIIRLFTFKRTARKGLSA